MTIKGFLINPFDKTITNVEVEDTLEAYYKILDCECIDGMKVDNTNHLWVDDNGYFREDQAFFTFGRYPNPIAGKALILGCIS